MKIIDPKTLEENMYYQFSSRTPLEIYVDLTLPIDESRGYFLTLMDMLDRIIACQDPFCWNAMGGYEQRRYNMSHKRSFLTSIRNKLIKYDTLSILQEAYVRMYYRTYMEYHNTPETALDIHTRKEFQDFLRYKI